MARTGREGGGHRDDSSGGERPDGPQQKRRRSGEGDGQPSPAAPPAPAQGELSEIERLKLELEKARLEKELALQRLETEKAKQQLKQLQDRGTAASEGNAASGEAATNDSNDAASAMRKPAPKKRARGTAKAPGATRKKKPHSGGRSKLTAKMKRQLSEAQRSKDEQMKHQVLKAYEEDMAAMRAASDTKGMHQHTEKELMSRFKPEILDHHWREGDAGKFLVKWIPQPGEGKGTGQSNNCCRSWIAHEDFLFPDLGRKFLKKRLKNAAPDEMDGLKLWIEDCKESERCLKCLNTFHDDDEFEGNLEIDFCCFLCKCTWDHPLKRTIRNCEEGLKLHRGCCHGYTTNEDFDSFVSPVGKVQMELIEQMGKDDGEEKGSSEDEEASDAGNNPEDESVDTSQGIAIRDGDCERYRQCLQYRSTVMPQRRDAVVVCINDSVGSATDALKRMGIKATRIIHVAVDRVAQHVIRSNHDFSYGEVESNDGIEHIVGLFETLPDIAKNAEQLVQKYGPIDIIIGGPPKTEKIEQSEKYEHDFLDFVKDVETLNREHHRFDHLFYLLQIPPSISDHLPLEGLSRCIVFPKTMYVCNWPISCQKASLQSYVAGEDSKEYVLGSVKSLYSHLRKALCVGFDGLKWRDEVHPKLWLFLSMGPRGYDMKLNRAQFGLEAFSLRLRSPDNSELLSDAEYSTHLLKQSSTVGHVSLLLQPLQKLFNEHDYGPRYHVAEAHQEAAGDAGAREHGLRPNSNDAVGVAESLAAVKTEVKEEEDTDGDDEEAGLFGEVENSLSTA